MRDGRDGRSLHLPSRGTKCYSVLHGNSRFAPMSSRRVVVVGGGAAGFFAAITCAEAAPDAEVLVLERGPQFLSKVRISGGGRCNVTHACFDARELSARFPRGGPALIGP